MYQKTIYNFKLGIALSKRPHFNSAYLLRVPFSSGIAAAVIHYRMKQLYSVLSSKLRFEH